jgi:hypothetical protein
VKKVALGLGLILGLYLIGRAAVELATMHYTDPASYRLDWGGPSLAGVLTIHCGPGVVALGLMVWWVVRSWRRRVSPR